MTRPFLVPVLLPVLTLCSVSSGQENVIARREAVSTTMSIASYTLSDCVKEAGQLKKDIDAFVVAPSEINLVHGKLSWMTARLPFLQVRNLLWVDTGGTGADRFRGKLDGRPVALVDIEKIIADSKTYPEINSSVLRKAEIESGGGALTGFAAIEALIWLKGEEDHKPFLPTFPSGKRRGAYLAACAKLLHEDLQALAVEFSKESENNTRAKLKALKSEEALSAILEGQANFITSELVGLRLQKSKEKIFLSETSHTDVLHGVAGIANVLAGACYGTDGALKVQGTGVLAAIESEDVGRAGDLRTAINEAVKAAQRLPRPLSVALERDNPEYNERVDACRKALNTLVEELTR